MANKNKPQIFGKISQIPKPSETKQGMLRKIAKYLQAIFMNMAKEKPENCKCLLQNINLLNRKMCNNIHKFRILKILN